MPQEGHAPRAELENIVPSYTTCLCPQWVTEALATDIHTRSCSRVVLTGLRAADVHQTCPDGFDLARFKCALQIVWGKCQNTVTVAAWDATRSLQREDFETIRRKLKCSRYGAKEARTIVLPPPPSRN